MAELQVERPPTWSDVEGREISADQEENETIVPPSAEGGDDPIALALTELWETDSLDGTPAPVTVDEAVSRQLPAVSALAPGQLVSLRQRLDHELMRGRGEWRYLAQNEVSLRKLDDRRRVQRKQEEKDRLRRAMLQDRPELATLASRIGAAFADDERRPPTYDLYPVVIRGGVTFWIAPPASFKSLTLLSALVSMAEGGDWMGLDAGEGVPVLYLAGEGSEGLMLRLAALEEHRGRPLPQDFHALPVTLNLRDHDTATALLAAIRDRFGDRPPRVIAIDTVSTYLQGGDENGPRDTGQFMATVGRLRDELGCSVILVHHVKKGTRDLRGHGNFEGAADAVVSVKRSGKTKRVRIDAGKTRDHDETTVSVPIVMREVELPESFGLRPDGSRWSSLVPVREDSPDEAGEPPPASTGRLGPKVTEALRPIEDVVRDTFEETGKGLSESRAIELAGVVRGTGRKAVAALLEQQVLAHLDGPRGSKVLVPFDVTTERDLTTT